MKYMKLTKLQHRTIYRVHQKTKQLRKHRADRNQRRRRLASQRRALGECPKGEWVLPIGTLVPGHAGCPADACLHWGLRRGDTYLDPLRLLVVRVRLLPLI